MYIVIQRTPLCHRVCLLAGEFGEFRVHGYCRQTITFAVPRDQLRICKSMACEQREAYDCDQSLSFFSDARHRCMIAPKREGICSPPSPPAKAILRIGQRQQRGEATIILREIGRCLCRQNYPSAIGMACHRASSLAVFGSVMGCRH